MELFANCPVDVWTINPITRFHADGVNCVSRLKILWSQKTGKVKNDCMIVIS